ncbi:hypothetical protein T484DRAFT_1877194 [Baffinella frigidus]|nr:hypothetical protein T484DRAFT_1877194 [Cryptophyta sp. CCMP2293]
MEDHMTRIAKYVDGNEDAHRREWGESPERFDGTLSQSAFALEDSLADSKPTRGMTRGHGGDSAKQIEILKLDAAYRLAANNGRVMEAGDLLERSLFVRVDVFGPGSPEADSACRALVTHFNSAGMQALHAANYPLAFELLRKAEFLTRKSGVIAQREARLRHRAISLNNLGCVYRRRKKLHAALRCLEQALTIELSLAEEMPHAHDASYDTRIDGPADTHLNLAAVLSELGQHNAALSHVECALTLLPDLDPLCEEALEEGRRVDAPEVHVYAAACHNAAVEHHALNHIEAAVFFFDRAHRAAAATWGLHNGEAK